MLKLNPNAPPFISQSNPPQPLSPPPIPPLPPPPPPTHFVFATRAIYVASYIPSPPPPLSNLIRPFHPINGGYEGPPKLLSGYEELGFVGEEDHHQNVSPPQPPRLEKKKSTHTCSTHKGRNNKCLVWVPKNRFNYDESLTNVTSLMIKNIPNRYTRAMLLEWLDEHCRDENDKATQFSALSGLPLTTSQYDFVYLPIDFKNKCNLGYAFVNFTSDVGARRLHQSMNGLKWKHFESKKVCCITCARIQGKAGFEKNFMGSYFQCDSDGYLPVSFDPARDGWNSSPPCLIGRRGMDVG
ncbi:Protein terminal ear1 [Acorus calamus]|uniref:Protein terminal ear1 n=1 Tax=Acorus calamus TaxID=4465 RepID=A0AAV9E6A6_ACOCL|nr:Protein terminal ear1 [Acorus calamus]